MQLDRALPALPSLARTAPSARIPPLRAWPRAHCAPSDGQPATQLLRVPCAVAGPSRPVLLQHAPIAPAAHTRAPKPVVVRRARQERLTKIWTRRPRVRLAAQATTLPATRRFVCPARRTTWTTTPTRRLRACRVLRGGLPTPAALRAPTTAPGFPRMPVASAAAMAAAVDRRRRPQLVDSSPLRSPWSRPMQSRVTTPTDSSCARTRLLCGTFTQSLELRRTRRSCLLLTK